MNRTIAPGMNLPPNAIRVARLIAKGLENPQIAEEMGLTRETVKCYVAQIRDFYGITGEGRRVLAIEMFKLYGGDCHADG